MKQSTQNQRTIRLIWISVGVVLGIVATTLLIYFISTLDRAPPVEEQATQLPVVEYTASGTPDFLFTDITQEAGIDFTHVNGAYGERLLPETMGSGVAFFDYDLDGDEDLLLINSTRWSEDKTDSTEDSRSRLFENDGSGKFTDVTESKLDLTIYGMGVAVGDYNGDGYPDIFVTAVGKNKLLRNLEGERFVDVTNAMGVGGDESSWSTCATFLDYDQDGDLDLFVCNYVDWSPEIDRNVNFQLTGIGRAYGPPTDFAGTQNWLYLNDGSSFIDVSMTSGVFVTNQATGQPVGKALAVLPLDLDDDSDTDLVVANDTVRNFVYINQGNGQFIEEGIERGIAFDSGGAATGAMGIDGTYIHDIQSLAIAIGNFANEMTSYYVRRDSDELFSDDAIISGIGAPTRSRLTFGVFFADLNLDGLSDFFSVNGHVEPEIQQVQTSQHYRQRPQIFWACGPRCGRYYFEVEQIGDLNTPKAGRAAAYADIDQDGDLDIVVSEVAGRTSLYRNDNAVLNNWIRVKPLSSEGHPLFNSKVLVTSSNKTQKMEMTPTRSYLSQVELALTFGLGQISKVDQIIVEWPDGTQSEFTDVQVNQLFQPMKTD